MAYPQNVAVHAVAQSDNPAKQLFIVLPATCPLVELEVIHNITKGYDKNGGQHYSFFPMHGHISANDIKKRYEDVYDITINTNIWSLLDDKQKILIERYKHAITLAMFYNLYVNLPAEIKCHYQSAANSIYNELDESVKPHYPEFAPHNDKKNEGRRMRFYKWALFYFLVFIDFLPIIIGGFVYASTSLSFLPIALPDPIRLSLVVLLNMLHGWMIYSYISPLFKQHLGIPTKVKANALPQLYQEQLILTERINEILLSGPVASKTATEDYKNYVEFAKLFNANIVYTTENFPVFKEAFSAKALRWFLMGMNIAQSIGGTIFMAKALLMLVAPSLALTAFCTILIIALAGCHLLSSYFKTSGLYTLINTAKKREYNQIKKKFEETPTRTDSELEWFLAMIKTNNASDRHSEKTPRTEFNSSGTSLRFFPAVSSKTVDSQTAERVPVSSLTAQKNH